MTTFDFAVRRLVRVVDGDTIDLEVDLGFRQFGIYRFRLLGVDTPEIYGSDSEAAGYEAQRFVEEWIGSRQGQVRLRSHKTGSFGRWLAEIYDEQSGEQLGHALVRAGLAEEY